MTLNSSVRRKRSRDESLDISFEDEEDDDPLCTEKQKYPTSIIEINERITKNKC